MTIIQTIRQAFRFACMAGFMLAFSGCQKVAFHQKAHLMSAIMQFESDPTETHFYQKSFYSREGSVGGIGGGAGGGCGCY